MSTDTDDWFAIEDGSDVRPCNGCGVELEPAEQYCAYTAPDEPNVRCATCAKRAIRTPHDIDPDIVRAVAAVVGANPDEVAEWVAGTSRYGNDVELTWFRRAVVAEAQRAQLVRDEMSRPQSAQQE